MILLINKGARLNVYDNNKKRPTDYICEWSEEAVARLNTVTDGKYKYTGSTAVESKLGDTNVENIGNTPSILDSLILVFQNFLDSPLSKIGQKDHVYLILRAIRCQVYLFPSLDKA